MAQSWIQRVARQSSTFLQEAFSEPGVLHAFEEELLFLREPASTRAFQVLTDEELGGLTTASLQHSTDEGEPEGCLIFEGNFTSEVPSTAPPEVHRLGQAALGTKTTDNHYFWLGEYDRQVASTINYRIKGDGRLYGLFMKTDSYFEGTGVNEIWQAYVRTKKDEWMDVKMPMSDYLLTCDGYLTEQVRIINLRRVTSLGFSVPGGRDVQHDGPFKLCISRIAAGYDSGRPLGAED